MALVDRRVLELPFRLEEQSAAVAGLLARYRDAPMSLADACLLRMSELWTDSQVLTCDSHFRPYRRSGRRTIPTLMPAP